jgi:hypothetical protein
MKNWKKIESKLIKELATIEEKNRDNLEIQEAVKNIKSLLGLHEK